MGKLKIFSFFAGSGFLDLGFEKNGYEIEFVNEFSKSFITAYKYSREKMGLRRPKYGYSNSDVDEYLSLRKKELKEYVKDARIGGNMVGFIGGPPCPDFSVAGKQKGRDGNNGKLSQSYIQLIIDQKPDFFLFENVKGLWSTAKHRAYYEELKGQLSQAGYIMVDRLTNALEFGAPQDRERILLFGIKKSKVKSANSLASFDWNRYMRFDMNYVKSVQWPTTETFAVDSVKACPEGIPEELTVQYWFTKNDVENHPNSSDHFTPRSGLVRMQTIQEGDDSKKSYKRIHRWRYSPTACYGNNEVHLHPYKERRLSASEALAIQSLPKEFELPKEMTLTDKFKTIGNGVPFMLSQGIAKTIFDFMYGSEVKWPK